MRFLVTGASDAQGGAVVSHVAGPERRVGGPARTESVSEAAEAEVVRHHRVIERWLSGAADPAEFAAFADAHAPAFRMVGVDGVALERREVLSRVRSARGHAPDLTIGIRDVRVIAEAPRLLLVSYEEWHGADQGRHATAVLVKGAALRWLHLHETRIPA